jgi:hypothetical protein
MCMKQMHSYLGYTEKTIGVCTQQYKTNRLQDTNNKNISIKIVNIVSKIIVPLLYIRFCGYEYK